MFRLRKVLLGFILFFIILLIVEPVSAEETLDLHSHAAVLTDSVSGQVLFEKNGDKKMYPASLTKIATAIYAIEKGHLDDTVIVSENVRSIIGTKVYLLPGETVTLKHLIQGLLINSGNDAGLVIAEHLHGTEEEFSLHINEYLKKEIGVVHTNFTNPHGLFDKNHYTTARDLAAITNYALKNDTFREIYGTKKLNWHGEGWDTTLITHHLLLKGDYPYEGISGGKTGYVNQSGHTLATTASNEKIELTVITMKTATKRANYHDTMNLLDYGFQHYQTEQLPSNKEYKIENKLFTTQQPLFYTIPMDETVSEEISDDGILFIRDSTGNLITSFQLVGQNIFDTEVDNPKVNTIENNQSSFSIYMLIVLTGLLLFWFYSRFYRKA